MTEANIKFIQQVIAVSSEVTDIPIADIMSKSRKWQKVMARSIGWMIIYDLTAEMRNARGDRQVTLEAIGALYGGFDHATVLYGRNAAREKIWGSHINPPITAWAQTYDEMMNKISLIVAEGIGIEESDMFFPFTAQGHVNARKFLKDIGEKRFSHASTRQLITFANTQINTYRV
jgi:hypothetical protein